jgi:hypothetical protein
VSISTDDYTEDRMALEVLTKAVPSEMMGTITNKVTAMAAWDTLYLRNVGAERVRKARVGTLRREFDSPVYEDGELIDDFGNRITHLTTQLVVMGNSCTEEEIVRRFLQALPPKFDQIAASIETLLDPANVSLDELTGRLKPVEEKMNRDRKEAVGKLNLMEDELVALLSSWLKATGSNSPGSSKEGSSGSKRVRGRGKNNASRGCTATGGRASSGGGHGSGGGDIAGNQCRYCSKKGHWARECKKKKQHEQAQVDDEGDSTLLITCAGVEEQTEVHLGEPKLFVQLGDKQDVGYMRWILDSGTTNHMMGEREAFSELDTKVHGTVRFGDGSVTKVEGCGTILLKCKNGEHKVLAGVYFILWLTVNIVSLRQLEEDRHQILLFGGYLQVLDHRGILMARVA